MIKKLYLLANVGQRSVSKRQHTFNASTLLNRKLAWELWNPRRRSDMCKIRNRISLGTLSVAPKTHTNFPCLVPRSTLSSPKSKSSLLPTRNLKGQFVTVSAFFFSVPLPLSIYHLIIPTVHKHQTFLPLQLQMSPPPPQSATAVNNLGTHPLTSDMHAM